MKERRGRQAAHLGLPRTTLFNVLHHLHAEQVTRIFPTGAAGSKKKKFAQLRKPSAQLFSIFNFPTREFTLFCEEWSFLLLRLVARIGSAYCFSLLFLFHQRLRCFESASTRAVKARTFLTLRTDTGKKKNIASTANAYGGSMERNVCFSSKKRLNDGDAPRLR